MKRKTPDGRRENSMTIAVRTIAWIWWSTWYATLGRFQRNRSLESFLKAGWRTRRPWWTFRPTMYHSDAGGQWQIVFDDETDYTEEGTLRVRLHIGQDSGRIVGLTIYDEVLKQKTPPV